MKLENCVTFHNGKGIEKNPSGSFPVYGSNGLVGRYTDFLYENAIIVGRVGAYCGSVQIAKEKFWATDNTIVLMANDEVDLDYLYYYLSFLDLNSISGGSAQPLMTHGFLKNIEIKLPEKIKQVQIGSLLSLIDENILKNHETLSRIRDLLSLVFRYWFRDFEFPDSAGKPYKSSGGLFRELGEYSSRLPVEFTLHPLAGTQVMKMIPPGVREFSGKRDYLATSQVADYRIQANPPRVTYSERESRADMSPRRNSVWFAKMKNTKKFLFFGSFASSDLEKYVLSTGFAGLEIDDDYFEYMLSTIDDVFFERIKDNMCVGATQEAINLLAMKQIMLPIPPRELAKKYKAFSADFYQAFYEINSQNVKLEKMRNSLLAGLMSGSMIT